MLKSLENKKEGKDKLPGMLLSRIKSSSPMCKDERRVFALSGVPSGNLRVSGPWFSGKPSSERVGSVAAAITTN